MSLGEAFVEVRADLRPFGRDLQRSVKPMVEAFERELNNAVGRAALANSEDNGRKVGDRLGRGIKRSLSNQLKDKNVFIVVAAALGSALDDGISALPTEVKAALVAGILLATPLIAAFLTGAIVAATGAGLAVFGTLLAAQFESVQTKSTETFQNIRRDLVGLADDFEPAILNALATIEVRLRLMGDLFADIFDVSAGFVEPLVQGLLNALQAFLESIQKSITRIRPFVDELGVGFAVLGNAIGTALEILVRTGDDGVTALRDLFSIVGALITAVAVMLFVFTKLYGIMRKVVIVTDWLVGAFSPLLAVLAWFLNKTDEGSNKLKSFANTNAELTDILQGVISATKGETDALDEYRDALDRASDSAKDQLDLSISWEESLDRIRDSLHKNGKTLDITTDKGRENVRAFREALEIAEEASLGRVRRGELTAEQAALNYDQEIAKLRDLAHAAGISDAKFNELYGNIILTAEARISAQEMGVESLAGELGIATGQAQRLYDLLQLIKHIGLTFGRGAIAGARGFADGGILHFPETIRAAEDGPEVILPLTKPARAAQLLQQSGLSESLGGGAPQQILVFVGNEQLDSRMVRIVGRNTKAQAMALSQGGRAL